MTANPQSPLAQSRPAEVAPPPAVTQSTQAAQSAPAQPTAAQTTTQTYIPLPIPAQPAKPSLPGALLSIGLILLFSLLARLLWRLPERMREHEWVHNMGGPYAVQNRFLHALGYMSFIAGFLMNNFTTGVMAAALLMIAANTRPQGYGDKE